MTTTPVSAIEMRAIDSLLAMESGYVLDFTDRTFAEFFRDYRVQIDHSRYSSEGGSKAKRLRFFLRVTQPPLSGKVLAGLLEYLLATGRRIDPRLWGQVADTARRLGGTPPTPNAAAVPRDSGLTEDQLLRRTLQPAALMAATRDPAMAAVITERLQEAERCIGVDAYLAAVVLSGSVLEALCLEFGASYPEVVNRGFQQKYQKVPPKLPDWRLQQWVDVLGVTGDLSPNIEKFGHALRDFRNYIHPAQQLASGFRPNKHTATISLRVVAAAIDDLAAAYHRRGRS
jgi:hypothetical protein